MTPKSLRNGKNMLKNMASLCHALKDNSQQLSGYGLDSTFPLHFPSFQLLPLMIWRFSTERQVEASSRISEPENRSFRAGTRSISSPKKKKWLLPGRKKSNGTRKVLEKFGHLMVT